MVGEAPRLFDLSNVPARERVLALPEPEEAEERIHLLLPEVTEEDMSSGLSWYFDVNQLCQEWSAQVGQANFTPIHAAGIIAALSPMRSWPDNIRKAREVLDTGTTTGLGHTLETAQLIRHGFDPEFLIGRTGQNLKVQAFFNNIAFPDTSKHVTVDRHMWTFLCNDFDVVRKAGLYFKSYEYEWASDRVRNVAADLEILPHQLQSVIWLTWRRKLGIVDDRVGVHQGQLNI